MRAPLSVPVLVSCSLFSACGGAPAAPATAAIANEPTEVLGAFEGQPFRGVRAFAVPSADPATRNVVVFTAEDASCADALSGARPGERHVYLVGVPWTAGAEAHVREDDSTLGFRGGLTDEGDEHDARVVRVTVELAPTEVGGRGILDLDELAGDGFELSGDVDAELCAATP